MSIKLGLTTPTPIQEKSFSVIMSGRDVMGIAQTGTGKTLAYLLPLLKQWKFIATDSPRIVILVPTRELVVQIVDLKVESLTKYMSVRTLGIYGGVNINTQKKAVYQGIDILVGTPGRTMDLALDNVIRFDSVQKLVIDEFDEILNLGFRTQVTSVLTMLKNKRQNILFSATMTDEVDAMLDEYQDGLMAQAERVGALIRKLFAEALAGVKGVVDIRGHGLMIGLELDRPCGALVGKGLEAGLLINVTAESVVRFLPPLIFTERDARELVEPCAPLIKDFLAA